MSVTWSGWLRPRVPLPAEPQPHVVALVLLSDYSSHRGVETRLGPEFPRHQFVSLDHALWIHRPVRRDDWLLMNTASHVCHDGRALTRREIFTRDGLLVASVTQEALVVANASAGS
jgi:acyl-CoA thioesterase-2